ncbi:MAG: outer membrane beta-barrel protein [Saprospiraceae bacterium]|nr:outer membrane beta-barrel protein [Saprospiraceae bacterium]
MKTIKRLMLVAMILFSKVGMFAQLRLGAGSSFAFKSVYPSLQIKGTYDIDHHWRFGTSLNYFLENDVHLVRYLDANFDVHYNFLKKEKLDLYALGGANYSAAKFNEEFLSTGIKNYNTELGFNLGAGALLKISRNTAVFFETKRTLASGGQFFISVGLLFSFGGK